MTHQPERRALLGGLAAVLVAPAHAAQAVRAGAVETSRGECFARGAAARRPLTPAAEVFVGDAVGTGVESALGLRLGAATRVRLGAETQLKIDRFIVNAGGLLVLDRGAMLYDHDPKDGADTLSVRSPYGLLAVRGTRFFAGPSNGVFGVFVEQGTVLVFGPTTGVRLTPGFGTNIATPGAEPTAPALWGKPRIGAALASVGG